MSHLPHFVRKRPCRICHCWFQPAPQAGERQHVCGKPGCQQERHRRACQAWHGRERAELAEVRQVARLKACVKVAASGCETASTARPQAPLVKWTGVRAVPPEVVALRCWKYCSGAARRSPRAIWPQRRIRSTRWAAARRHRVGAAVAETRCQTRGRAALERCPSFEGWLVGRAAEARWSSVRFGPTPRGPAVLAPERLAGWWRRWRRLASRVRCSSSPRTRRRC